MDVSFSSVVLPALPYIILLIAWVVAIVFAVRIYRRKREKAELLLLIGVCLMLAGAIISIVMALFATWLTTLIYQGPINQMRYIQIASSINIFRAILSLGGIILMVIAFWKKFKPAKEETAAVEDRGDLEL